MYIILLTTLFPYHLEIQSTIWSRYMHLSSLKPCACKLFGRTYLRILRFQMEISSLNFRRFFTVYSTLWNRFYLSLFRYFLMFSISLDQIPFCLNPFFCAFGALPLNEHLDQSFIFSIMLSCTKSTSWYIYLCQFNRRIAIREIHMLWIQFYGPLHLVDYWNTILAIFFSSV